MRVLKNNVVCHPAKAPELTAGGLHIPDSMGREYKCRAFVIQVGPEVKDLKKGDEIIFAKADKFTSDTVEYVVLNADDVLLVL